MVHTAFFQAKKNAENQKQPISVTDLQHDFGVTNEMDQELQHFLISRTEEEALEVVRGAEREPSLEQWRRLAPLYDPLAAGRSLDDRRQILSPPKAAKMDDLSQAWENVKQRKRERTGDQLPIDMRLAIIFSMCPTDLETELTAQQHLFPHCAQMRAHIVTVINSRTCGPAPMMMGNVKEEASNHDTSSDELVEVEMETCTVWKTARKFSPSPGTIRSKATPKMEGKAEPTKNVLHWPHQSPQPAPKGKGVGSCEEEEQETSQNVPWGTIGLGSFEVLSDHGDTEEDDEESSLFDCWDEQSDVLQHADPWAQNAPKSIPSAKRCTSVNFPVSSVSKVGCVEPTVANYSSPI